MTVAPYGSWVSPVTPERLVEGAVGLDEVWAAGDDLWWNESRPGERGRQVVVRLAEGGGVVDVVPDGFSARTTVHEYGGGSYTVQGGTVWFSNFDDQRVWRAAPGAEPVAVTPPPPGPRAWRYADGRVMGSGDWGVWVRERHDDGGVVNDLVVVSSDGDVTPLVEGRDFFAAPRPTRDGTRLAWLAWDHPNMPWDATELWVGRLADGPGGARAIVERRLVAGGADESISQPRWSPEGVLHWVSDRTGWWNLYAEDGPGGRPLAPLEAELSGPDWTFGQSTYAFLRDGRLAAVWSEEGLSRLGVLDGRSGRIASVETPFTRIRSVQPWGEGLVAVAAGATSDAAVVALALDGRSRVLRRGREQALDERFVSRARPVSFPTEGGRTAHALYYPPVNPDFRGPAGDRPPLVVNVHGGPTSAATPGLDLRTQFWTTRGLAVVDVDYGGSSGYGRAYRQRLDGNWGVVDVADCVHAALFLADQGEVDRGRMVIRGSSAGGYTTLRALTTSNVFAAGTSLYGVVDLEALAASTHKFESRYLDRLVGPLPAALERYRQRSPLYSADRLARPVLILQGLEDAVVPPAQAEMLVQSLEQRRVPYAYVTFEGEQHGFRRADSIRRAAEVELSFYGQVLGFEPAGSVERLPIRHL